MRLAKAIEDNKVLCPALYRTWLHNRIWHFLVSNVRLHIGLISDGKSENCPATNKGNENFKGGFSCKKYYYFG